MENRKVIIIGAGHLAHRILVRLQSRGIQCRHIQGFSLRADADGNATYSLLTEQLSQADLPSCSMAYLVDEKDDRNLQYLMALVATDSRIPVTVSLFNENIAPHLQAAYPQLRILNPARIAASAFADALSIPVQRTLRYEPRRWVRPQSIASDRLLWLLLGTFALLVTFSIGYFHYSESLTWLDACYFVVVTVASVGYGDISTFHSSPQAKVVNIFLILGAMVCVWMIFSLLIDRIIRQRIQLSLGRRRYTESGHIIVCGLGRLGHCVAEELLRRGHKVVAVEVDENSSRSEHLRQRGVPVYTGNARAFSVLEDVNVVRAAALISVIDDDYANLEIALNARSIGPDLRLVLRIYDEDMARQVSTDLDIHLTLSMSALADQTFASAMDS